MSIKINYPKGTTNKSSRNIILFTNEKLKLQNLKNFLTNTEFSYVSDLLKARDPQKNLIID